MPSAHSTTLSMSLTFTISLDFSVIKLVTTDRFWDADNLITVKVHNLKAKPAGVKLGNTFAGSKIWSWDDETKLLEIKLKCNTSMETIEVIKQLY